MKAMRWQLVNPGGGVPAPLINGSFCDQTSMFPVCERMHYVPVA